jgi:beta-phosphoglucomutase-like phosphatase (HAD superfamily)
VLIAGDDSARERRRGPGGWHHAPPHAPAAVLFDNDGLTVDTESIWTRAETALFARHGETFTLGHKREMLGTSVAVSSAKLERMLGRPGDEPVDELHELVLAEAAAGVEPMPGAVALLDALGDAGVPIGLVSNSRRDFVEAVLRAAGVRDAFAVVVTAEDVARPKPAPTRTTRPSRRWASPRPPASSSRTRQRAWPRRAPPAP